LPYQLGLITNLKILKRGKIEKSYFNLFKETTGADAIKKFTPRLGIPDLGVSTPR